MKKRLVILAVLVAFAFTANEAFAYGRKGGKGGLGPGIGGGFMHLSLIQTELGLSDKQLKQIFDIGTQYREKRFESRNDLNKLNDLREEHRKAVESVLTKDQLEKFNDLRNNNCRGGWRR
ncbi:MAG: hypothetical protein JXN64_08135 [Spirochaetes bacterium]|nr:hypothetical protein [Spirochaetota bacterium]